jgi:shikimate kinase
MIISLTGFMGCGKSSLGRRLSELLCCSFMDLDDVIVERAGRSIPEIFETDGEAAFRQMEREVLRDIITSAGRHTTIILALGGGAVMQEECEKIVHESTMCIYLKASVETLLSHLEGQAAGRPLLNTASVMSSEVETSTKRAALKERILDLMAKRATTYERTAHHIIDTDNKTIEEIAAEICCILNCQA